MVAFEFFDPFHISWSLNTDGTRHTFRYQCCDDCKEVAQPALSYTKLPTDDFVCRLREYSALKIESTEGDTTREEVVFTGPGYHIVFQITDGEMIIRTQTEAVPMKRYTGPGLSVMFKDVFEQAKLHIERYRRHRESIKQTK